METGKGLLQVIVTTANGAFPVANAQVVLSAKPERVLLHSARTDESGKTDVFTLAAPPAALSEIPQGGIPYAEYRLEIRADGFYPVIYEGVPIFEGIKTDQPVSLVPIRSGDPAPAPQIFPPYSTLL